MRKLRITFLAALIGLLLFSVQNAFAEDPLPPVDCQIVGAFGADYSAINPNEPRHTGVDYGCDVGTQVHAPAEATVVLTSENWQDYGRTLFLEIELGNGVHIWKQYAHLSKILVENGQKVKAGEVIALTGASGRFITGPHLHEGTSNIPPSEFGLKPWQQLADEDPQSQGWIDPSIGSIDHETRHLALAPPELWSKEAWIALFVILGALSLVVFTTTGVTTRLLHLSLYRLFWGPSPQTVKVWKGAFWLALMVTLPLTIGMSALEFATWNHVYATRLTISPIFTPEVQAWDMEIDSWAIEYDLDPNLIATVMQIESCGNANAGSPAGAQGLFQVMPYHFAAGEDMLNPRTNAARGLVYLKSGLGLANGNVGLALAGYNGGHGQINKDRNLWPEETRRYFYYGVGIYEDARSGKTHSERLDEWLAVDGGRLCPSTLAK